MGVPPDASVSILSVSYDSASLRATLRFVGDPTASIWSRVLSRAIEDPESKQQSPTELSVGWPLVLELLRDFGSRLQQSELHFRFRFEGEAATLAGQFAAEVKQAESSRLSVPVSLTPDAVVERLSEAGFTPKKRKLRDFQIRDLVHLASLPHGANFSVPGAGKTTVTFALHLLVRKPDWQLIVIGPKSAFPAWTSIVNECIEGDSEKASSEGFVVLDGDTRENQRRLSTGTRFVMSYDLMIRQQSMLASHLARRSVHLVLDEAHRMKAGASSQRGSFLLRVSHLAARRDILTGTPMPQGPDDLASQLAFLWPGQGFSSRLQRGGDPREVLGNLYVRTTKAELGLPKPRRHFLSVEMQQGQMALYGLVRSESLRQLTASLRKGGDSADLRSARKSVMRLLQLSANPILALRAITEDVAGVSSGIADAIVEEAPSAKIRAVCEHVRRLAAENKKVVVWTIFTDTLLELETQLAALNPVTLFGGVPSGEETDLATREGRLRKFHNDPSCMVLIANPAASGEGISLHTVCHNAIYLDRSYVSTHYLQSTDRIHRLGLPPDVETNIYIYRTHAPRALGSVDMSVSRRLAKKVRALQQLLNDTDLHEIALDEELADDPVDYSVDLQDLVDLVEELEGKASEESVGQEEE